MTSRRIALCLALALTASVFAQKPNFKFIPGPKPGGGDVKITVGQGGTTEMQKDEYAILQGEVMIEYQDIKLRADKITYNFKTRDAVAEGHVIIDQGPTRITANQAVYNLDSKTGTFFNATGTMDPSMYFSDRKSTRLNSSHLVISYAVFCLKKKSNGSGG